MNVSTAVCYTRTVDMSYPVIVREKDERILFMDGLQRLLKAVMDRVPDLEVKFFSDKHILAILHEQ